MQAIKSVKLNSNQTISNKNLLAAGLEFFLWQNIFNWNNYLVAGAYWFQHCQGLGGEVIFDSNA